MKKLISIPKLSLISSRLTVRDFDIFSEFHVRRLISATQLIHQATEKQFKVALHPQAGSWTLKQFELLSKLLYSAVTFTDYAFSKQFVVDLSGLTVPLPDNFSYEKEFIIDDSEESDLNDLPGNDGFLLPNNLFISQTLVNKAKTVCLGGCFDHMHNGHKLMLTSLITNDVKVAKIGLVCDEMLANKTESFYTQCYQLRRDVLEKTLKDIGFSGEVVITPLDSVEGNAGKDDTLDALLLTEETLKGGGIVNERRIKNGLQPIDFILAELLTVEYDPNNLKSKESSSFIRNKMFESRKESIKSLFNSWTALTSRMGIEERHVKYWFDIIRDNYCEAWRFYHDTRHIERFLKAIEENEDALKEANNLKLAAFFHDVLFNGARKDSEERSRDLFLEFSKEVGGLECEERVVELIMNTKEHFKGNLYDEEANYFMDCDLVSFGDDFEEVIKNSKDIRKEFFFVTDEFWNEKRPEFLEYSLGLKIYKTDFFEAREKKAKENIKKEIEYWRSLDKN